GVADGPIAAATSIDPWFLSQIRRIVDAEHALTLDPANLRKAKRLGFSDARIADLLETTEDEVRARREAAGIRPTFQRVDTCAAEMPGTTPYLYATWETESEHAPSPSVTSANTTLTGADGAERKKKVVVLGAGPNRIGQGIEFDYCCVHAV